MNRAFACLIFLILFLAVTSSLAWAGEDVPHKWSVGARGSYMILPDFILDAFYEKHTSIEAGSYGLFGSYSFAPFDLVFGIDNYALNFENGEWLKKDEDEDETDYVEADLGFTTADVSVIWKFPINSMLTYRLGAGLGFGFLYGEYESYDVVDGKREEDKHHPKKPPVIPVATVLTGLQVFFVEQFSFNVDLGLRNGLFFGGGLQYYF